MEVYYLGTLDVKLKISPKKEVKICAYQCQMVNQQSRWIALC